MKEYIIDILAIAASISTIIAAIAALITLRHLTNDKNEKLEYEVKKIFYDGKFWTNEGFVGGSSEVSFDLRIDDDIHIHNFSGEISDKESNDTVYFHFEKSNKKVITLDVYKMSESQMYVEGKEMTQGLGKIEVEYNSPDVFIITFIGDCLPHLPRETAIFSWSGAA
ncbi:hypothetical protein [Psychrobacter sp. NPDC077938]|uniref:hypothetical protein n=1 Tax=Psychrobacter sp. NPDC077938 TaxID=3364494 RepID=UPI0037C83CD7